MRFLISILTWYFYQRFQKAIRNPQRAQKKLWKKIHRLVGQSKFWVSRHSDLSRRDLADFPITTYDDYSQDVKNSLNQSISPLNGEKVLFFAQTSGTTGERKYFPYTQSFHFHSRLPTMALLHSLRLRAGAMANQPSLYLAAPNSEEKSSLGIEIGYVSYYQYNSIPSLLKKFYGFPVEVFKTDKIFSEWAAFYALATDLNCIFAVAPYKVTRLVELIQKNFDFYKPYLQGQKSLPEGLPLIQISKERWALIEAALSGPTLDLTELWPSLSFICCWTGASCSLQLSELKKYANTVPIVETCYAATEAVMTVPLSSEMSASVCHPGAQILEFLPIESEMDSKNLIPSWQLKPGEQYEIFITSPLGLIRYRLFDVVCCRGFVEKSPLLEFLYKSNQLICIGHSRLNENVLIRILKTLNLQSAQQRVTFTLHEDGRGLELLYDNLTPEQLQQVSCFDDLLSDSMPEYIEDLRLGLLKPLRIRQDPELANSQKTQHAQGKLQILRAQNN